MLKPLKEDATIEDMRAWILDSINEDTRIESELAAKTSRELVLQEENQKLFILANSKQAESKKEVDKIPSFIDEDTYKLLDNNDKKLIKELNEEE